VPVSFNSEIPVLLVTYNAELVTPEHAGALWITHNVYGYKTWLAAGPMSRQSILTPNVTSSTSLQLDELLLYCEPDGIDKSVTG
jgi:hypothetical protein